MQKIALYRKYRPENFSDVVGQTHIVKILGNAVKAGKVSHAYLFSGPRGTGKTSIARILAKSLNCLKRKDENPCGKCTMCIGASEGRVMDLIEIDAASNRGIDEIRDLREKAKFSPTEGEYKVFIIDEVHMLTKEAFNALLKTLEEPPEHTIFILATTEINKVPATIISRCQRHDFRRIKVSEIIALLSGIAKRENFSATDDALEMIAEASEGGLRDAISLIDQLNSLGLEKIEESDVELTLGLAPQILQTDFADAILSNKPDKALGIIKKAQDSGIDLINLTKQLSEFAKKLLYIKLSGGENLEGTKEQLERLKTIASTHELERIIKLNELLVSAQDLFKTGVDPASILMLQCAKIATPTPETEPVVTGKATEVKRSASTTEKKSSVTELNGKWKHFLMEVKAKNNTIHAFLRVANPELTGDKLKLVFPYKFHKERLEEPKNKRFVEQTLTKIYGQEIHVICELDGGGHRNHTIEDVQSAANILGGEFVD